MAAAEGERKMNAILHTDKLAKKFGKVEALSSLSLSVPEGSVFALVGPNGAGKSTTMKICLNMVRASSGVAEVLGADSRRLTSEVLAKVGYVSETRQLPEWMKVGRFLSYCKEFYPDWTDADVAEFVRAYELPLDRPLKSLSRGQRVKAALAASLAYRPKLLFLDEPFSNLDVLVRDQLIETLLEAGPETTVFLASHDLAEIENFATHVAYLHQGSILFTEEMSALAMRFREVEVVLENASPLPSDLPSTWLNPAQAGIVVRFADSRFDSSQHDAQIRRHFPQVREVNVQPMALRSIFVALAKSAK
jgi:ABC-2 type transport system ATP-binding protein